MGIGYGYVSDFLVVNLQMLEIGKKFQIGMNVDLSVVFKIQFYCFLEDMDLKMWFKVDFFVFDGFVILDINKGNYVFMFFILEIIMFLVVLYFF